jgi:hypothetical protein
VWSMHWHVCLLGCCSSWLLLLLPLKETSTQQQNMTRHNTAFGCATPPRNGCLPDATANSALSSSICDCAGAGWWGAASNWVRCCDGSAPCCGCGGPADSGWLLAWRNWHVYTWHWVLSAWESSLSCKVLWGGNPCAGRKYMQGDGELVTETPDTQDKTCMQAALGTHTSACAAVHWTPSSNGGSYFHTQGQCRQTKGTTTWRCGWTGRVGDYR